MHSLLKINKLTGGCRFIKCLSNVSERIEFVATKKFLSKIPRVKREGEDFHALELGRDVPDDDDINIIIPEKIYKNSERSQSDRGSVKDLALKGRTSLSSTLTPALEEEITGDNLGRKFALKQAVSEIIKFESRAVNPMPMPESLSVSQWKDLISLNDRRTRFHYLDSLLLGKMSWAEIESMDEAIGRPPEVTEEMLNEALGESEEARRRVKIFQMHHEIKRQEGMLLPFTLNTNIIQVVSELQTTAGILKYLDFLEKQEINKLNTIIRKRLITMAEMPGKKRKIEEIENCKHIYYGLGHNSINLRIEPQTIKTFYNKRAMHELIDGVPLVIDCSFTSEITLRHNLNSLVYQEFKNCISNNREAVTPYALHFTNMNQDIREMFEKGMSVGLPTGVTTIPAVVSPKSTLELFPRERLVMLSPESRTDLEVVREDDIYVIGGLVDRGKDAGPHTLTAAKKLGLRHARLPLKKVLGLQTALNVDTVVAIMADMRATQDWFYAFRWVPARIFANRVKTSALLEHKLTYRAHKALSPTASGEIESARNKRLNKLQYKALYGRIVNAKSYDEMIEILKETRV